MKNISNSIKSSKVQNKNTNKMHLWDLFCLLLAVLHGMDALVYNNRLRETEASKCLAIIFVRIAAA